MLALAAAALALAAAAFALAAAALALAALVLVPAAVALSVGVLRGRGARRGGYGCSGSHADRSAYGGCARSRTAVITGWIIRCGRMVSVVGGWRVIPVVGVRGMVRGCPIVVRVRCTVTSLAGSSAAIGVGVARATVVIVGGAAAVFVGVRRALAVRVGCAGPVRAAVRRGTITMRGAAAVTVRVRVSRSPSRTAAEQWQDLPG